MGDVGVLVEVRDVDSLTVVGTAHAPAPIEVGDLVAFEHGPVLRVVAVFERTAGRADVPVLARPAALAIAAA